MKDTPFCELPPPMVRIPNHVKAFLDRVRRLCPDAHIFLFGSRASGHPRRDSDWDFFIVSPLFRGEAHYDRTVRIHRLAKGAFALDVLCYTPREFEQRKRQLSLVNEAVRTKSMIELRT